MSGEAIQATGVGPADTAAAAAAAAAAAGAQTTQTDGKGTNTNGSGDGSSTTSASPGTDNFEWVKAKGWQNEDGTFKTTDILKGYQSLEQQRGKMVTVPDEKATQEERDAFAKRLGWPGDIKGYELKVPTDLPAELPYSSELADQFKVWANEQRLSPVQAQAMHDNYVKSMVETTKKDVAAYAASVVEKATAVHGEFVKAWGDPKSETYTTNIEASRRALRNDPALKGLEDELKVAGLLTPDGNFTSLKLGMLLASHGKQFLNDKFVAPNGASATSGNPFIKTLSDGKPNPDFNLTIAGQLINRNPDEARRLIQSAGQDPKEYGL